MALGGPEPVFVPKIVRKNDERTPENRRPLTRQPTTRRVDAVALANIDPSHRPVAGWGTWTTAPHFPKLYFAQNEPEGTS